MRNSSTRSNWMPYQEIFQRGKPTGAVPKGHMLYVRNQKQFAAGRQLGQTPCGSHRCATAPAHIIVSATENERRNFYLGSLHESVPGKARILVTAKDFHRALSRPNGVGQGHHHVAIFAIKFRVKMPWYHFRCKRGCNAQTPCRGFLVRYRATRFSRHP